MSSGPRWYRAPQRFIRPGYDIVGHKVQNVFMITQQLAASAQLQPSTNCMQHAVLGSVQLRLVPQLRANSCQGELLLFAVGHQ